MMHHGVEWLDVTDARSFEHWIEDNRIDAIFCGHTHQAAVDPLNDVNREIMQFTAGALVIDHYAIPSFYICDFNEDEGFLTVTLWSFSAEIEQWAIDNHHLRKFHNNGKHTFTLNRFKKQKQAGGGVSEKRSYEDLFQNLNDRYNNIAVEKKVTKQETASALFELKDILDNLINNRKEESWNKTDSRPMVEQIHELFSNAEGFLAKSPVKYFDKKAFFVTPYWDYYQREMYNLGKDILVCMLYPYLKEDGKEENSVTCTESLKLLVNYLLKENKRQITEIVLYKPDITSFSSEERKNIRELFKNNGINVRCIFIQERDFSMIKENGWRKELFRVLQISKNTKWG